MLFLILSILLHHPPLPVVNQVYLNNLYFWNLEFCWVMFSSFAVYTIKLWKYLQYLQKTTDIRPISRLDYKFSAISSNNTVKIVTFEFWNRVWMQERGLLSTQEELQEVLLVSGSRRSWHGGSYFHLPHWPVLQHPHWRLRLQEKCWLRGQRWQGDSEEQHHHCFSFGISWQWFWWWFGWRRRSQISQGNSKRHQKCRYA